MPERKRYVHISFDRSVAEWVQPLVQNKVVGYESLTEFVVEAVREKLDYYLQIGMHPWASGRRTPGKAERMRIPAATAAAAVLVLGVLGVLALTTSLTGVNAHVIAPSPVVWDFLALYKQYWFFIDFLIYSIIFVSLAYATVGRMLGHRGIAVGIGLFLAVAMAGLEATAGFAIRDMGILAAAFLTLVMGTSLYHVFRKLHFDVFGAATVTMLLVYLGVIVMMPPLYAWLYATFPFTGLVIAILFVLGVYHLLARLLKERPIWTQSDTPVSPGAPELQALYPELKEEQRVIQTYLSNLTARARKDAKTIAAELTNVYHVLAKCGDTPEGRRIIAEKLKSIMPAEQDLDVLLKDIHKLLDRIRALDAKVFGVRNAAMKRLSTAERKKLQKELKEELGKLNVDNQLTAFETRAKAAQDALLTQVNAGANALGQGDVGKAKQSIVEAIKQANQASAILDEMKAFEELLNQITKNELEALKPK